MLKGFLLKFGPRIFTMLMSWLAVSLMFNKLNGTIEISWLAALAPLWGIIALAAILQFISFCYARYTEKRVKNGK